MMYFMWEMEKFVHMFSDRKFAQVFQVENEEVCSCVSGGK